MSVSGVVCRVKGHMALSVSVMCLTSDKLSDDNGLSLSPCVLHLKSMSLYSHSTAKDCSVEGRERNGKQPRRGKDQRGRERKGSETEGKRMSRKEGGERERVKCSH